MKEAGILEPVPIDKNDTENFDLDLECDDLLADESLPFNDDVYAEDDVTDLVDFQPDFHPFDD